MFAPEIVSPSTVAGILLSLPTFVETCNEQENLPAKKVSQKATSADRVSKVFGVRKPFNEGSVDCETNC
jgi:hypothetical protein